MDKISEFFMESIAQKHKYAKWDIFCIFNVYIGMFEKHLALRLVIDIVLGKLLICKKVIRQGQAPVAISM